MKHVFVDAMYDDYSVFHSKGIWIIIQVPNEFWGLLLSAYWLTLNIAFMASEVTNDRSCFWILKFLRRSASGF